MDIYENLGEVFFASSNILNLCLLNGLDDDLPIFSGSYIPVGLRELRNGDFMFRYLRTLVAWQQAVHLLFVIKGRLDILSSLRVCCITLTTHYKLNERSSLLDSTKRVFENKKVDAVECQAAQSWIDEQLKRDLAMEVNEEWCAEQSETRRAKPLSLPMLSAIRTLPGRITQPTIGKTQ